MKGMPRLGWARLEGVVGGVTMAGVGFGSRNSLLRPHKAGLDWAIPTLMEGANMKPNPVLRDVPDYKRFLTVDELNGSAERLARQHPQTVRLVPIGRSTDGETIRMLRIGHGPEQLLFFACPHPNEPIGAMTLEYLSHRLAEDDQLRGTRFTWNLIKCIDPDGTRLNEGWFAGPFTVTHYAAHFYRPAAFHQAEWTFPVVYKTLTYLTPIPETQALMSAIAGLKPRFIYSQHNAGFGGGYYYLSPDTPLVYDELRALLRDRSVPLALGEPEMPWAVAFSPAVYRVPTVTEHYDFLEKYVPGDPAAKITGGASSFEYARPISNPAMLICELPYFYDTRIENTSPAGMTRKQAILDGVACSQEVLGALRDALAPLQGKWAVRSRFVIAVENFIELIGSSDAAKAQWAEHTPELDAPATVAQAFDNLLVTRFYRLLVVGMARRALELELRRRRSSVAERAMETLAARFQEWAHELERDLDYRVIPIKKLVEIQLGAALAFLAHL